MYTILFEKLRNGDGKMAVKYADYEQQGEFFGDLKCSITIENYNRYKDKYGEERAMGYLQAIKDFNNEFAVMRNTVENKRHIKPSGYAVGPTVMQKALEDFSYHNSKFLNNFTVESSEAKKIASPTI